jgi:TPR repeat protein
VSEHSVDVIADPAAAQGGHARIRLNGVGALAPDAIFRIEPLDAGDEIELGWPAGDQRAADVRVTQSGVEFGIGPAIVDAPPLRAGTPVRIIVPAASVDAELRWPALPASVAPPQPAVIMSPAQRAAEATAILLAKQEAEREASRRAETAAAEATRLQAVAEARARESLIDQSRADDAAEAVRLVAQAAQRAGTRVPPGPVLRAATDTLTSQSPIGARPITAHADTPPPPAGKLASLSTTRVRSPVARFDYPLPAPPGLSVPPDHGHEKPAPKRARSMLPVLTFCVGLLIPTALAGVVWQMYGRSLPSQTIVTASITPAAKPTEPAQLPPVRIVEPAAPVLIEDMFAVGSISPRGQSAGAVTSEAALAMADRSLHGVGQTIDREEARFWLRKSLALQLSGEQVTWALTQLGTLYATPDQGAPDYAKARTLWEIAAAQGDPIALCFLSSVHELGLGAPVNRATALTYAERAKAQGGCRDIDATLARLK